MSAEQISHTPTVAEIRRKDHAVLLPLDAFAADVRKKAGLLPDDVRLINLIPPPSFVITKKALALYIEEFEYNPHSGWNEYLSQFRGQLRGFFTRATNYAIDVGYQTVGELRRALYEELVAAQVLPATQRYFPGRKVTQVQAAFLKIAFEEFPEENSPGDS